MLAVLGDLLDLAWRAELARRSPGVSAEVIEEYCDFELHPSMWSQREELRPVLAAVLAEHARQVRAQNAVELQEAADDCPRYSDYGPGLERAAEILRGEAQ
jgi:hypothetical protein